MLEVYTVASRGGNLARQPGCPMIRMGAIENCGPSTSRLFLLFLRLRSFDCFPVPRRVSLPIHAYGPASPVNFPPLCCLGALGALGLSRPRARLRHRAGIQRN